MAPSPPHSFVSPAPEHWFSRINERPTAPFHSPIPPAGSRPWPLLRLAVAPDFDALPPLSAPLVVLAAAALAFSAQSWINSLLGGDRGLGAFLSDGTGFNRSGFKPRRGRPVTDERSVREDPTRPLGGGDPLPWLKLPELDYVEVAGQPKITKPSRRSRAFKPRDDDADIVSRLESLRQRMKDEVERGNFENAKRIESELEGLMKDEGFDYSE